MFILCLYVNYRFGKLVHDGDVLLGLGHFNEHEVVITRDVASVNVEFANPAVFQVVLLWTDVQKNQRISLRRHFLRKKW